MWAVFLFFVLFDYTLETLKHEKDLERKRSPNRSQKEVPYLSSNPAQKMRASEGRVPKSRLSS